MIYWPDVRILCPRSKSMFKSVLKILSEMERSMSLECVLELILNKYQISNVCSAGGQSLLVENIMNFEIRVDFRSVIKVDYTSIK